MEKDIQEKIKIIEKIDTYDARFIVKVLESFRNKQKEFEKNKKETSIINENIPTDTNKDIIDLDEIWAKPYFYTRMRVRLEELVKQILYAESEEISINSSRIFKRAIFNNAIKKFEKPEDKIDIVDFIKELDDEKKNDNLNFVFVAKNIDEETIFKEEQIKKAIEIIKLDNIKERYSKIYDETCKYLNKDFISNQYCDFKNNKCIAQRKHRLYPINRKDGCCFMQIRKCQHLDKGKCKIECMACRLFACKYLGKRGIGYWANEIILLKAFFTREQRKHLVFDFYMPKENVLDKIYGENL